MTKTMPSPTRAWVDAMAARREANGHDDVDEYRERLLAKHGLARRTGRSPRGNLRNFAAMGVTKFALVYAAVAHERNDAEAMEALELEYERRGL